MFFRLAAAHERRHERFRKRGIALHGEMQPVAGIRLPELSPFVLQPRHEVQ